MKIATWISIAVVMLLLGWFAWPTPWRYHSVGQQLVRIHGVTRAVEHHDSIDGWVNRVERGRQRQEKKQRWADVLAQAKATCEPLNVSSDTAALASGADSSSFLWAIEASLMRDRLALNMPQFFCTNPTCTACRDSVFVANGEFVPSF